MSRRRTPGTHRSRLLSDLGTALLGSDDMNRKREMVAALLHLASKLTLTKEEESICRERFDLIPKHQEPACPACHAPLALVNYERVCLRCDGTAYKRTSYLDAPKRQVVGAGAVLYRNGEIKG